MSNKGSLKEFLSRLLGKALNDDDAFILSSAQRARVIAWAQTNNFPIFDKELRGNLSLNIVSGSVVGGVNSNASSCTANIARRNIGPAFGVGIDIQRISELFPDGLPEDPKASEELNSFFTFSELSYAQSCDGPIETLAGLFAAKEAVIKAGERLNLRDIEVLPNTHGIPTTAGYSLSISHSGDYAVAIALPNSVTSAHAYQDRVDPIVVLPDSPRQSKIGWDKRVFDLFVLLSLCVLFFIVLQRT